MKVVLSFKNSKIEKSKFKIFKEKIASTLTLSANMLRWYEKVLRHSGLRIYCRFWEKLFCILRWCSFMARKRALVRVLSECEPFCPLFQVQIYHWVAFVQSFSMFWRFQVHPVTTWFSSFVLFTVELGFSYVLCTKMISDTILPLFYEFFLAWYPKVKPLSQNVAWSEISWLRGAFHDCSVDQNSIQDHLGA